MEKEIFDLEKSGDPTIEKNNKRMGRLFLQMDTAQ